MTKEALYLDPLHGKPDDDLDKLIYMYAFLIWSWIEKFINYTVQLSLLSNYFYRAMSMFAAQDGKKRPKKEIIVVVVW